MISLDTNVFIYALEGSSEFAIPAQKLIETAEREGAVVSVLIRQELLTGVLLRTPDRYEKVLKVLEDLQKINFVSASQEIVEESLKLTKVYGKKAYGYDAVHLATAIYYGISKFYTNDKELLKLKLENLDILPLE